MVKGLNLGHLKQRCLTIELTIKIKHKKMHMNKHKKIHMFYMVLITFKPYRDQHLQWQGQIF